MLKIKVLSFLQILSVVFWFGLALAQWQPDRRLTFNDSSSLLSYNNARCIGTGPGGLVHVVWYDNRDGNYEIYYKHSTDFGASWDTADNQLTNPPHDSHFPSIAVSDSTVHLVWVDYSNFYLYYKRSSDGGFSWSSDTSLIAGGPDKPSLSVSGSNVNLVYEAGDMILYKHSSDNGLSWSSISHVSLGDSIAAYPCIATSGSKVHVVWEDDRFSNWDIFYRQSPDGGATWNPEVRLTSASGSATSPAIAVSDSLIHVVWRDTRNMSNDIYYKRSTDGGNSWSADSLLTTGQWDRGMPSVAASGSNVHVAWWDGRDNNFRIFYKHSTNSGATWSSDTCLAYGSNDSRNPSIAVSGPYVHVVWQDDRDGNWEIYYKRNPTGNLGVAVDSKLSFPHTSPLRALPNPFISFTSAPNHDHDFFELYDITGRVVGTYRGDRIGSNVPPGVYFLKAYSKNSSLLRVVKVQ